MFITRLLLRTARKSTRDGFTLVELLVVIGIIAILAGVALGPITNGIKQAQHNAAMQTGRQIGQMCFSFSTDNTANGNKYPSDQTGVSICQDLINANYATDPSTFGVAQQKNYAKATSSSTGTTMVPNSVSWSFTVTTAATNAGITSSASDLTPLVFFNNGFGSAVTTTFAAAAPATVDVTYGANAPFGTDGVAIFYKGNNAVYLKAGTSGTIGKVTGFVSGNDTDTTSYTVAP